MMVVEANLQCHSEDDIMKYNKKTSALVRCIYVYLTGRVGAGGDGSLD